MQIDLVPTLIDQYRETFEGDVRPGMCWITDGTRESALLGTIEALTPQQAHAAPRPGGKSIAAHVEHLRFTLELNLRRLHGENPPADWPASFNVRDASPAGWEALKRDVRRAYEGMRAFFEQRGAVPAQDWQPIHLAGLAAMIGHNAYHLGAIRQIAKVVTR